ncbi:hypothetical protein N9260_00555 [bacterium]|nr:hypothetical protein [bacterium]
MTPLKDYAGFKHLPPLAGLADFEEAASPGLSVQECVGRLKRYHYGLQRVWQTCLARLTAEPIYEIKMGLSHHAHLVAEHIGTIRARVAEMRHPPLGLDAVPDPQLERCFDEILNAPTTYALIVGLYGKAMPTILAGMCHHLEDTNLLVDSPSVRILKHAMAEIEGMIAWGESAGVALKVDASEELVAEVAVWLGELDGCLTAAGGLDGTLEIDAERVSGLPSPRYSAREFVYDSDPKRDERFQDPYNMGVHAEVFLHDNRFADRDKVLMMYYRRLREIDVPEMMASILYEMVQAKGDEESGGYPWKFHQEMTRQLWDEARHAMMGEVGFAKLGIDWSKLVRINFTWSKGLNEQLTPKERHAVLWYIEQGQMGKTGKRYEWEVGRDSGDHFAELIQDYDWADEVLHARIGRDWYVKGFEDVAEAAAYGSECWNKVVSGWEEWKCEGLTEHYNWWPGLYAEACRLRGETPDEGTAVYDTSYADTRADLKRISGASG